MYAGGILKRSVWRAGVMAALLAQAGAARAETHVCAITPQSTSELISPQIRVTIVDSVNDIRIEDAITTQYMGGWVRGRMQASNAKRMTMTWVVPWGKLNALNSTVAPRKPTIVYSLTVLAGGEAILTVKDVQNRRVPTFRGTGICQKEG
jgi:hypothetical protein